MNKKILLSSLAILASFGVASAAFAADPVTPLTVHGGTVNFKGEITDGACAIDPDSIDQTVQMGQVKAVTLKDPGAVATAHSFSIKLDDCSTDTYKNVAMSFLGKVDDAGSLALTDVPGSAKNVGIDIYDPLNKKVVFDGTSSSAVKLINGTNNLLFSANYVSNKGGATAGTANAITTFNVVYS
ncbi:type-1 fimbrial protein subunit A [Photobacterium angustum]|uniref:Type-1 fimbrial protein subunit A n=1 Tax=Photobacterium angustum TaxID=661 RepID=A0A855SG73_PHOAN|nr:fimbrial protein [Photobacterium angustum]KJF82055.1 hypothetical protein UB36_08490 [Photobacterium damselae subsp. damselae]KJG31265.1 hypothetical protein UA69_09510 [Photobacterium angustum]KJG41114.1 hypothetical protein UA35_10255 [Photobacterium angustum]KJG45894.1 hypothetical protein UA31_08495 [Photobacterium angustum]KJG48878.1 hypothetical protein UA30_10705 [Photobacterium angustum]